MGAPTIYSTKILDTRPEFKKFAGEADSIIAVTAYASPSKIQELWDFAKKGTKIRSFAVYIDAGGSGVLGDTNIQDEYRDIDSKIRRSVDCPKSGIHLINLKKGGIFHPKSYVFQSKQTCVALIGSYNFTANAEKHNEEILLKLNESDSRGIYNWFDKEYLPEMREHEVKLDEITSRKLDTFREFLLSGYLANSAGKGKFWHGSYGITVEAKETIADANDPTNAVKSTVDGQFDIQNFLPKKLRLRENEEIKKANKKSQYSVTTTMGKWVPRGLEGEFLESQQKSSSAAMEVLKALSEYLRRPKNRESVEHTFERALNEKTAKEMSERGAPFNKEIAIDSFRKKLSDVAERLQHANVRTELAKGTDLKPVPDVWFFDDLGEDFEESFIENLNSRKASPNLVLKRLRKALNLGKGPITRDGVDAAIKKGINPIEIFKSKRKRK